MRPANLSAYLADAHTADLRREAQRDALAREALPPGRAVWSAALLPPLDVSLAAGHRLRARLAHRRIARLHRHSSATLAAACHPTRCGAMHSACLEV